MQFFCWDESRVTCQTFKVSWESGRRVIVTISSFKIIFSIKQQRIKIPAPESSTSDKQISMTFVHDINDASGNSDNGSSGKDDRKCVLKITKGLISFFHPEIHRQFDPPYEQ